MTRRVPFPLWTSVPSYIWEGGHHTTPGKTRANTLLGPPRLTLLGEQEGLAESAFWVKLGGVLSLRLWAL